MRHPYEAAVQARSLAVATGQPVIAGFGAGARSFQRALLGAPYASPLTAVREYIGIVRDLLDNGRATLDGEYFHVDATLPAMTAPRVDLGLGVLRAGMARLAGQVADAAITWLTPAQYLRDLVVPEATAAARSAGRPAPRVVAVVPVVLDAPGRKLDELVLASNAAHLSLPHYASMLTQAGIPVTRTDLAADARALVDGGAFLLGSIDEVVERLGAYADAGVDEVVLNATGVARTYGTHRALADLETILAAWDATAVTPPAAARGSVPTATAHGAPGITTDRPVEPRLSEVGHRLLAAAAGARTGSRTHAGRTVVLADDAHLEQVLASSVVGTDTVVLAPSGRRQPCSRAPRVLPYEGELGQAGPLVVGGALVIAQAPLRELAAAVATAPTVALLSTPADLDELAVAARAAREDGRFPSGLVSPHVRIAEVGGLTGDASGPESRLFVDRDGAVAVSPSAEVVGEIGDPLDAVVTRWQQSIGAQHPAQALLGRILPSAALGGVIEGNPWLARFVESVEALRHLQTRGVSAARVSGFGGFLAAAEVDRPPAAGPVVAWAGADGYLVSGGRVLKVAIDVARIVDQLVHRGPDEGGSYVPTGEAAVVAERLARLGIATGVETSGSAQSR